MKTFNYEFEELPLVIHEGIEAAFINGSAEIEYSKTGEWKIGSISVEGFGERVNGKRQWPQVPVPDELAAIILKRLDGEWYDRLYSAVIERISEDRECAADDYADMRRDRMRESV